MAPPAAASNATSADPFRVMVVDDSAIIRGLLTRYLERDDRIKVISSTADGQMALNVIDRGLNVELVVLDIEMPNMDGLTALPKLLERDPSLQILMASTLTRRNAEVSLKALSLGAADYVPKPTSRSEIHNSDDFQRELVDKVLALGDRKRAGRSASALSASRSAPAPAPRAFRAASKPAASAESAPAGGRFQARKEAAFSAPPAPAPRPAAGGPIALRPAGRTRPDIVAIGSSTGGPQALFEVLGKIKSDVRTPIIITQHMPATFTAILAEQIGKVTDLPTKEGATGDVLEPGHIFVAPGDHHMIVESSGGRRVLKLTQTPPENFCRPAVDPMLRSVAATYGAAALAVILTGMGQDGMLGCRAIVEAGGTTIAQDEETSVVWGMPGAPANSGVCSAVLPLTQIGDWIKKHVAGR